MNGKGDKCKFFSPLSQVYAIGRRVHATTVTLYNIRTVQTVRKRSNVSLCTYQNPWGTASCVDGKSVKLLLHTLETTRIELELVSSSWAVSTRTRTTSTFRQLSQTATLVCRYAIRKS